jgi:hypothetical protein
VGQILNTENISLSIDDIIHGAKRNIVLISPYVDPRPSVFQKLLDASDNNKQITLVCDVPKLKPEVRSRLSGIRNLEILSADNVHAKCYFNEEKIIITSLNLLSASEAKNKELGVLFEKASSPDIFSKAYNEAIEIVWNARNGKSALRQNRTNGFVRSKYRTGFYLYFSKLPAEKAFCIRCANSLPGLDGNYPLCDYCFISWAQTYNYDVKEKYCHWCGKAHATTKNKPLCAECFRKYLDQTKFSKRSFTYNKTAQAAAPEEKPTLKQDKSPGSSLQPSSSSGLSSPDPDDKQRKKKNRIALGVLLLVAGISITSFLVYALRDNKPHFSPADYRSTIKKYFAAAQSGNFEARDFFALHVDNYFNLSNVTPGEINREVQKSAKEFQNPKINILDSTFAFSGNSAGQAVVTHWIDFRCFRNSKKKLEHSKIYEEFTFDDEGKIVSLRELAVKDLLFTR